MIHNLCNQKSLKRFFLMDRLFGVGVVAGLLGLAILLSGCGRTDSVDAALDSDANGYLCMACQTKFYTDRKVFPTKCPSCKKLNIEQAILFICQADKQVNIGPRSVRSMPCQKCSNPATGLGIPRETDLKAWGALHKSEAEVN